MSRAEMSMSTPFAPLAPTMRVRSSWSVMASRSCMSTWMVTRRNGPILRMGILSI